MSAPKITAVDFASRPFDFLIIGGGTAGLAVAARLSEDPNLSVGVLEAGPDARGSSNDGIDVPGYYGQTLGSELDWQFETTPQAGLGGRTLSWPRGKVLGGTSALHFMTWNRASRQDYDAWEELGCAGWGWDSLLPFFKKSENFHPPSVDSQREHKAYYDANGLGTSGPIQVSYANEFSASHQHWHQTLQNLGVKTNKTHIMGSNVGAWTNLGSVDPATCTRSYAATAYYQPNSQRPNLVILTEALVEEIVLEQDKGSLGWTAKGVRFMHAGENFFVPASKEVILCAGSVQSPQILELSGIGNPDVLSGAGLKTKVANPNVGENLQDHIMAASIYEVDPSFANPDDLKQNEAAAASARQQYAESRTGPLTILANSVCYLPLSQVISKEDLATLSSKVATIDNDFPERDAIRKRRFEASAPKLGQIEFFFDLGNWNPYFKPEPSSGKKYGTVLQILQFPFSRGNIHIRSASPLEKPVINPRYYGGSNGELDREIMVQCAKFADKITKTEPLAGMVRGRVSPPAEATSDDELRDWIVKETITDWHPVGTCAMGGRGGIATGVVDERLRVYGVKGLRVIDASIMPLEISAHLQATVYAVAEKGAHMILEDLVKEDKKEDIVQDKLLR